MTTPTTLDVTTFPTTYIYKGVHGTAWFEDLIPKIKDVLTDWARQDLIRDTLDSFGFAISLLESDELEVKYDHPKEFINFVGGWGDDQQRYTANAIRKMRAAARTTSDTLEMVEFGSKHNVSMFENVVESQVDGVFPWGEFPYGGAVFVSFGDRTLLVGVSGLTQEQDDFVAGFIGKLLGMAMYLVDKEPDASK